MPWASVQPGSSYQSPTNVIASPRHNTDSNTVILIPLLVVVTVDKLCRMTKYRNEIDKICTYRSLENFRLELFHCWKCS